MLTKDARANDEAIAAAHRWLQSEAAAPAAAAVAGHRDSMHRLVRKLQNAPYRLTTEQLSLAIKHPELRARAACKFNQAERMWFDETLLEQATDGAIAAYKASRFPPSAPVTDFCCGLGGDAIALAGRGPLAVVDRSPIALLLTEANVRVQHPDCAMECLLEDAESHIERHWRRRPRSSRWAHIDPDRRSAGVRTSAWDYTAPGPAALERLRADAAGLAVKLAPAASPPEAWSASGERDWIGSRGQCRQQVVWCGELAEHPGRKTVTVVRDDGWERFVPHTSETPPTAREPGRYLCEPHAAVLAARLGEAFAAEHQQLLAAPHGGYITGDQPPPATMLATCFVVESWLPFDTKRVRKQLRACNPARLEIKRRGVQETPEQIAKRLKWRPPSKPSASSDVLTLIVARLQSRVVAMFCRRMP